MQFQISFFAAGLFFGGANSAVIDIQAVDLAFKPEVIHASPGDVLEFHFFPHNHSVVMGDFDKPCLAADSGGFYSGFVSPLAGEASTVFRVRVNDTKPFVFYCSQDVPGHKHCQGGMVGVVNANETALLDYKTAALSVSVAESPACGPFGGTLTNAPVANGTLGSPTTVPTTGGGVGSRDGSGRAGLEALLSTLTAVLVMLLSG